MRRVAVVLFCKDGQRAERTQERGDGRREKYEEANSHFLDGLRNQSKESHLVMSYNSFLSLLPMPVLWCRNIL